LKLNAASHAGWIEWLLRIGIETPGRNLAPQSHPSRGGVRVGTQYAFSLLPRFTAGTKDATRRKKGLGSRLTIAPLGAVRSLRPNGRNRKAGSGVRAPAQVCSRKCRSPSLEASHAAFERVEDCQFLRQPIARRTSSINLESGIDLANTYLTSTKATYWRIPCAPDASNYDERITST
jgi:hypothetical protein